MSCKDDREILTTFSFGAIVEFLHSFFLSFVYSHTYTYTSFSRSLSLGYRYSLYRYSSISTSNNVAWKALYVLPYYVNTYDPHRSEILLGRSLMHVIGAIFCVTHSPQWIFFNFPITELFFNLLFIFQAFWSSLSLYEWNLLVKNLEINLLTHMQS